EALEQSREMAQEVEPVHRDLVEAHIAAFEARAQVIALRLPIQGKPEQDPTTMLQGVLEHEADVRGLELRRRGHEAVWVRRPSSAPDEDWQTFDVSLPLPPPHPDGELVVEFEIDPEIDQRYQALGERQREIGRQRSSQDDIQAAVVQVVAGAGVLVLLLALAAGAAVARATTRKATALSRAMARVGEGDLQVRAHARGRDELASLARAFNVMLDELAQAQQRVA